jgi:hypothetical protein
MSRRARLLLLAGALSACSTSAPPWMEQPAFAGPFDPARLHAYCSETRGFGQSFGGARLENPGAVASPFGNRRVFMPRGDFAPFNSFQAGFTLKSRALHTVDATAWYATAAEALAAFDAMRAAMSASGRFVSIKLEERENAVSGFVGQNATYLLQQPSDPPVGLEVVLRLYARVKNPSTIVMECADQAVVLRGEREAV